MLFKVALVGKWKNAPAGTIFDVYGVGGPTLSAENLLVFNENISPAFLWIRATEFRPVEVD